MTEGDHGNGTGTVLRTGTGVDPMQGGAETQARTGQPHVHGREERADRTHLPEQPRVHGTMAQHKIQSNPRLVDDWMNPFPIPGEHAINTIKETYDKIKKCFST